MLDGYPPSLLLHTFVGNAYLSASGYGAELCSHETLRIVLRIALPFRWHDAQVSCRHQISNTDPEGNDSNGVGALRAAKLGMID